MEEYIKILEDYIKLINKGYCEDCNELCNIHSTPVFPSRAIKQAIENLLKAYKEDEAVIEEQNRMIDLIVDKFKEGTEYYYSEFDYMSKEDIKEYFRNKVKENKE